jgi:DNA mismatch repair ATPase MutL
MNRKPQSSPPVAQPRIPFPPWPQNQHAKSTQPQESDSNVLSFVHAMYYLLFSFFPPTLDQTPETNSRRKETKQGKTKDPATEPNKQVGQRGYNDDSKAESCEDAQESWTAEEEKPTRGRRTSEKMSSRKKKKDLKLEANCQELEKDAESEKRQRRKTMLMCRDRGWSSFWRRLGKAQMGIEALVQQFAWPCASVASRALEMQKKDSALSKFDLRNE